MSDEQTTIKIVILGEPGVGKSSIVLRFMEGKFEPEKTATTNIDFLSKEVNLDGESFSLEMWDTAGQERFRNITSSYYRGCDGAVLVFDVTDQLSLDNLKKWQADLRHFAEQVPMVVVANKSDRSDEYVLKEDELSNVKDQFQAPVFLVSALNGSNIDKAMNELLSITTAKIPRKRTDTVRPATSSLRAPPPGKGGKKKGSGGGCQLL